MGTNVARTIGLENILRLIILCCGFLLVQLIGLRAESAIVAGCRTDRILVQPKLQLPLKTLQHFHTRKNVNVLQTLKSQGGLQIVSVPEHESVSSLVSQYQKSGLVEFAEPDYLGTIASTPPNDPRYLDSTLWGLNEIDAADGWDVRTSAKDIVVAVLDTGVRYTHEDLASNMWVNPLDGSHGLNALSGSTDPSDDSGHGTMIAGVLGAVGNNGLGVVGVAWQVQIMACKCFDKFGVGDIAACVTCLDYALTNHARLVNASWGFASNSLALSNALSRLRDAGVIVVAAAGNNTSDVDITPSYPSRYRFDNVVAVAATTKDDLLATASNYGATTIHLGAPGEQIYSTFAAGDNFYFTLSGTSLAAPYVAGAFALLLAQYPAEPYPSTVARLLNGTDPVPSLATKCITGGRLNLRQALLSPIRLSSFRTSPSAPPQFRVVSSPIRTFAIESSSDLFTWSRMLTNVTSSSGIFEFSDIDSTNLTLRFYRAVKLP
jgi:subtilisin family serine protease